MDKTRLLPQIQTLPLVVDVCSSLPRGSNVICQFWIAFGNGRISLKNICMYDGGNTLCFFLTYSMTPWAFLNSYMLHIYYAKRNLSMPGEQSAVMFSQLSRWTLQVLHGPFRISLHHSPYKMSKEHPKKSLFYQANTYILSHNPLLKLFDLSHISALG